MKDIVYMQCKLALTKVWTSRWSTHHGATRGLMTEASGTTAWCFRWGQESLESGHPLTKAGYVTKSVEIQLTLEDSGSPRATSLGFSINDETCEVAEVLNATSISSPLHCASILTMKYPKTFPGPSILSPLWGFCPCQEGHSQGSLWALNLWQVILFNFGLFKMTIDNVQGCTTTL